MIDRIVGLLRMRSDPLTVRPQVARMSRGLVRFSSLVFALWALAARSISAEVPIGTVPDVEDASDKTVELPFVSVRAVEQDRKGRRYYGGQRGDLTAGICTVDPEAREKRQVIGLRQRGRDAVPDLVRDSDHGMVIYVHGYNVTFEQSCRDAAMLQETAGLEGRLLLFSWPSEGKVPGYLRDVGNMEWSAPLLLDLLLDLANRVEPRKLSLIGHSLGAKGVVDTAVAWGATSGRADELGRIILVAPDLDQDVFVRDLSQLIEAASSITLYVSGQDRALKASRNIRSQPRLGEGVLNPSMPDNIDLVNVEQKRWRFGGNHDYHLEEAGVSADLRRVLSGTSRRFGSRTITAGQD